LHTVWDELMLNHLIAQKHCNSSVAFRDYLIDKIGIFLVFNFRIGLVNY
jgi:hypothetical protein